MSGRAAPSMNEAERGRIAARLRETVRGEVRFDSHNRMLYATDASLYQVEPIGVVIPAGVDDAARAAECCAESRVAILPRGGGTSLAGQCTNRAVVVDLSPNCREVLRVDEAARTAEVEPGITIEDLNDVLRPRGLFFAPDPATGRHATIGGCIGNNAAGARSIRYGRTSENVLGVEAWTPAHGRLRFEGGASSRDARALEITRRVAAIVLNVEGAIRERFPKTVRRNAGYGLDMVLASLDEGGATAWWRDRAGSARGELPAELLDRVNLAHLLCGSEGTLALTLGATLRLCPVARASGLAVLGFRDLDEAIALVPAILTTRPTAVELLDDTVIDLARANLEYRRYVDLLPPPLGGPLKAALYVEYFAEDAAGVAGAFAALRGVAGACALHAHEQAAAIRDAWKLRKAGEPLLHGIAGDRKPITFVEDNAIPVENLAEFVREMRAITARHGTRAAFYAHASVGVLHVRPLLDVHDPGDRNHMRAIAVETADLAKRLGGVMSGEHGDGRVRGPLLERFYGPEICRAFREVKSVFDPANLMNPGMVTQPGPVESITERLRVLPAGKPVEPAGAELLFDYADQHGFRGAVEMCNGAGVCRKKQGGTMCPSYMATLDERHSTRGRGNALRLAITGQLAALGSGGGASPWSDPGTMETLRLCLSCKACKTECPSNVDIARLKAEYTAQRYAREGAPLAARLFGAVRTLNRAGSLWPALANWNANRRFSRWLAERVAGIDRRRSLPRFERSLSRRWGGDAAGSGPAVALFGDCFTMYNEPGIGLATRRVLEAFGYRVVLAAPGCCGRAKISTGLVREAIGEIDATIAGLRPFIEDKSVEAILVAEPSCLSAMKDDWLQVRLRSSPTLRASLRDKAFLPEEFLDKRWDAHPRRPEFRPPGNGVVLHGHCHQKALWGVESSARMLRRVAGDRLRVPDTGCCGMAGSFGFTRDRFDLSMRIAELSVFPAVRESVGAAFVATGTSCRHQVRDGMGVVATHPMEFLAMHLCHAGKSP